jgi:hypothetical protein
MVASCFPGAARRQGQCSGNRAATTRMNRLLTMMQDTSALEVGAVKRSTKSHEMTRIKASISGCIHFVLLRGFVDRVSPKLRDGAMEVEM